MKQEVFRFTLPAKKDVSIAALIAIKALINVKEQQDSGTPVEHKYRYKVHIMDVHDDLKFLTRWISDVYTKVFVNEESQAEYDLDFVFDEKRAYKLSEYTEKHIVQTFSILLGTDSEVSLPPDYIILRDFKRDSETVRCAFVLFSCDEFDAIEVRDMLYTLSSGGCVIADEFSFKAKMELICGADVVIGCRSEYTYIASALDKKVIELYPGDVHKGWFSKWQSPNYRMVYMDGIDKVPSRVIWRALENNKWVTM